MKKQLIVCAILLGSCSTLMAQHLVNPSIEGRWDITITKGAKKVPSWLEINHSGSKRLFGYFVGEGGSARPISKITFQNNRISFQIPPQWEQVDHDLALQAELKDDKLVGSLLTPMGENLPFEAVRAPKLVRQTEPVWSTPIQLFNGKDLSGWEALGSTNQWVAENGVLKSPKSGSNIRTSQVFTDFKLHVEFKYPKDSNSGIYLRGRYEVQVSDSKGVDPLKDQLSAIYGFLAPLSMEAKEAGEWQTFDITLVGRLVTVVCNGVTVIYKSEIPGITGGAMDSHEGEPGPIMIQGDHGPVEYRNIVLTPAK